MSKNRERAEAEQQRFFGSYEASRTEWLTALLDELERERDFEWWQEIVLVDNVPPTPQDAKEWLLHLSKHEQDGARAEGYEEARKQMVALASCPDKAVYVREECIIRDKMRAEVLHAIRAMKPGRDDA